MLQMIGRHRMQLPASFVRRVGQLIRVNGKPKPWNALPKEPPDSSVVKAFASRRCRSTQLASPAHRGSISPINSEIYCSRRDLYSVECRERKKLGTYLSEFSELAVNGSQNLQFIFQREAISDLASTVVVPVRRNQLARTRRPAHRWLVATGNATRLVLARHDDVEAKSDMASRWKMTEDSASIKRLDSENSLRYVPTFLGAHEHPPNTNRDASNIFRC